MKRSTLKRQPSFWVALAGIAIVPVATSADAYAAEELSEIEFSTDLPVVLSASRLYQPLNHAPSAVTVIDRSMIDASGARNIADLLRLVPGFQVGYVNGNWATVTRGMGDGFARQMQVLIDGRSVYSAFWGGIEWTELPITMGDIERIEVVRGPNAASYGANSFLGVINILTREPATEHANSVSITAGNRGVLDVTARLIGGDEDKLRYRFSVSSRGDDGFPSLPDSSRTNLANARVSYQVNTTDQVEMQFGLVSSFRGIGYSDADFDLPRDRNAESGFVQARWTHRVSADDDFWVQYAYSQRQSDERYTIALPPLFYPVVDYTHRQRRMDLEAQRSLAINDQVRASYGLQFRQDAVYAPQLFLGDAWQISNLMRFFGNVEWRLNPDWTLNTGTMYERTSLTAGRFSPRMAINWEFLPGNTLRAAWSKAERTPTLIEARWAQQITYGGVLLTQVFVPNPDITAERITSRELGYLGEFQSLGLTVDMRVFEDHLDNLLDVVKLAPIGLFPYRPQQAVNADRAVMSGTELVLRWRPWDGGWLYFSSGRMHIDSTVDTLVTGAPQRTSAVLFEQQFGFDMKVSAGVYRTGSFSWAGSDTKALQPPCDKVDLRIAKSFPFNAAKGEISLVTQNISHTAFDFRSSNIPQRTTFVKLDLPF